MKTFYKLTSEGFEKCVKLDQAFNLLNELDVDTADIQLPPELDDAYSLFEQFHDMEFGERDGEAEIVNWSLYELEREGYIEKTYEDND